MYVAKRVAVGRVGVAALLGWMLAAPVYGEDPAAWTKANLDSLVSLYQHFHQHPELSYHEEQTAAKLADELRQVGAEVTTGVGGHGVVGVARNGDGPTLLIRADMDALPVTEETGLVYASKQRATDDDGGDVGVMHACGHDIHVTTLVGVARYLLGHRDAWRGTALFLCQPAEERGGGAKAMLDDGLFQRFGKPDLAVALHVDATLAAGKVGYRAGYTLANVDSVDVTLVGRGGHGAYPHTTIDPIVMAARLVLDLQTIVSREIEPTQPAVVTVGSIHGGTKHNVIGDRCHLQITCRSYTDEVRQHLLDAIVRKAQATAAAAGAPEPEIKVSEGTPAMFNDEKLVERVTASLQRALGNEQVVLSEQSMGGEDFSQFGRAGVPICMFRLGSVDAQRLAGYERVKQPPPSLHSSRYYPDAPQSLQTGVTAMASVVLDLLPVGN
ncbi:MAG: amidohydrolase [Pirellulales bacterium]|nr:amidohydrolase [Pirellulales bacterium]